MVEPTQSAKTWYSFYAQIAFVVLLIGVALWYVWFFRGDNAKSVHARQEEVATVISKGDIVACDAYQDFIVDGANYRTVCLNNIYYQSAIKNQDVSVCDKLDNTLMRVDACKKEIMELKAAGDISICNAFQEREKEECVNGYRLLQLAKSINTSFCNQAKDQFQKTRCQKDVALEAVAQDPSKVVCNDFPGDIGKDCTRMASLLAKKSKIECALFLIPIFQNRCKLLFASNFSQ